MSAVTPPPLQEPTSKEKKYDRQLRLWAASGQAALEESHVLLINSGTGTTGIEALKNLILPGLFLTLSNILISNGISRIHIGFADDVVYQELVISQFKMLHWSQSPIWV